MSIAVRSKSESYLDRAHSVRDAWSHAERRRRASLGCRLQRAFLRQLAGDPVQPEIWAVGSVTSDDLVRFVRCG
jgi:hypothetical protein